MDCVTIITLIYLKMVTHSTQMIPPYKSSKMCNRFLFQLTCKLVYGVCNSSTRPFRHVVFCTSTQDGTVHCTLYTVRLVTVHAGGASQPAIKALYKPYHLLATCGETFLIECSFVVKSFVSEIVLDIAKTPKIA